MNRIPTGCRAFDDLLGGGIERGSITLLYGEAGSGKSNVCLQTARNVIRNGERAAYIDSEGLSYDRVNQIFGNGENANAKSLLVSQVHSFEEQSDRVDKTVNLADKGVIDLAIVDSINMFYRLNHDDMKARTDFVRQIEALLGMARKYDVAVLLTSQVYSNITTGGIEFLGGHALSHNSKTILRLDKKGNSVRTAVIIKHRSLPEGRAANYRITAAGIEDL
ncbi:MAG: DNA repair and recombination protein RadB [Candidatus Methanoplasma sp.]|nr:DNA repair and recombination protein RadB [Candidatus Methanoplasma sp.]